jgi:guanylate kinase
MPKNETANKGILLVISGPSGVGKNSVLNRILQLSPCVYSISATTRTPRPGEVDGKDYFFYTREEFEKKIAEHMFLEWACVYGDYYGTPAAFVNDTLNKGKDIVMDLDIQGARQVRAAKPDAVLVFLYPPSLQELCSRLQHRGTEKLDTQKKRLDCVKNELAAVNDYDYLVVNDDLDKAVEQILHIWHAEKLRVSRKDTDFMNKCFFDEVEVNKGSKS